MVSALHLHLAACLDSKYLIHFKLNYLVSEMASIDFFLQSIQGRTWPIGLVILIYLVLTSTVGVHNGGQKIVGSFILNQFNDIFSKVLPISFFVSCFWSLLTMKLQKYYVIFVYILQGKMGKTENCETERKLHN